MSSRLVSMASLTTVYCHYDYFTGRGIRIVLELETTKENLEAAIVCVERAKHERSQMVSKRARDIAGDAYHTSRPIASDMQLKVLDVLASNLANVVHARLLDLLQRELTALVQPRLV